MGVEEDREGLRPGGGPRHTVREVIGSQREEDTETQGKEPWTEIDLSRFRNVE